MDNDQILQNEKDKSSQKGHGYFQQKTFYRKPRQQNSTASNLPSKPSMEPEPESCIFQNGSINHKKDRFQNCNVKRDVRTNEIPSAPPTESKRNYKGKKESFKFNFDLKRTEQNPAAEYNNLINQVTPDRSFRCTNAVALDCEMVGCGQKGLESVLGRVSIVNSYGECIYDEYVKPREEVTDYRTKYSGIRQKDLLKGRDLFEVQREVSHIIDGKILVGHDLRNDFAVLYLSHPRSKIRDTAKFKPFLALCGGKTPSLKKLAEILLGINIQRGEHCSIEDARAAMNVYLTHKRQWEKELKANRKTRFKEKMKTPSV